MGKNLQTQAIKWNKLQMQVPKKETKKCEWMAVFILKFWWYRRRSYKHLNSLRKIVWSFKKAHWKLELFFDIFFIKGFSVSVLKRQFTWFLI